MYNHIKEKIQNADAEFTRIGHAAAGRAFTASEQLRRMELLKSIEDLKMQLPANEPLSMPGAHLGQVGGSRESASTGGFTDMGDFIECPISEIQGRGI